MPLTTVTAVLATTHRVAKYGGIRLAASALEGMASELNAGGVAMLLNHSATEPLAYTNMHAEVVTTDDGEHALEARFDVDQEDWRVVQDQFQDAGVPGGFSFAAGELQIPGTGGSAPVFSIAADAEAFSDADRAASWETLSRVAPAEAHRLYQFSVPDLARIIVERWPALAAGLGINLASSVIYDAIKHLVGARVEQTVIEIRQNRPDGTRTSAVVTTSDPEIVRIALEQLPDGHDEPVVSFDTRRRLWLPPYHE